MITRPTIIRVAVLSPLRKLFDYLPNRDDPLDIYCRGKRVKVPFGKREVVGIIIECVSESSVAPDKLKQVIEVIDDEAVIPETLLKLGLWASQYYHHPVGDVLLGVFPKWLREGRSLSGLSPLAEPNNGCEPSSIELNRDQQQAIDAITASSGYQTFLLNGVTASGKTEIYLQSIAKLKPEQQALVLVPEIALTPQTVKRFTQRFSAPISVLHSGLTDKKRAQAWAMAREGTSKIIIGTRSAIFAPMKNPGIIIIDEEHDASFKQQTGFRYSARDIAVIRGSFENIPVVLGSATPSLETLNNVSQQRYQSLMLPQRAGKAKPPVIRVLDIRGQSLHSGISDQLMQALEKHLANGNQVLLFLNRRGYAPTLMCHHCGWSAQCRRCDARLTFHQKPSQLFCHHCGYHQMPSRICPQCQQSELMLLGQGTERLEEVLSQCFPSKKILRIDRDTVSSKKRMQNMLEQATQNQADILVGTQMLAKGHHFPKLTLVAIIDVDGGLFSSDFRATERMAQLILQVAGRAGREEEIGEVILQTHQPKHPLLMALVESGYGEFAKQLLNERAQANLPPYGYLALIRSDGKTADLAMQFLQQIKMAAAKELSTAGVNVLGPVPAVMERIGGRFRAQLLLQSKSRQNLQQLLKPFLKAIDQNKLRSRVKWSLDVDPQSLF